MSIFKDPKYLQVTYNNMSTDYPNLLAKWIKENIFEEKTGSLLDVGCGLGDYLRSFDRLGYRVGGVDISSNVFISPMYKKMQVDLENEPNRLVGKCDFVFSKSVIEHIKNVDNAISFMYNNLNENGKILIMTPAWEYIYWGPFYCDHTHVTPFTKESLENILKIHNFKNVKVSYFYQLPFIWKYPFMKLFCKLINFLKIPYKKNKLIRFSREVMLLAEAKK